VAKPAPKPESDDEELSMAPEGLLEFDDAMDNL